VFYLVLLVELRIAINQLYIWLAIQVLRKETIINTGKYHDKSVALLAIRLVKDNVTIIAVPKTIITLLRNPEIEGKISNPPFFILEKNM